jgi:4-aminobutyrate aminotransferase-like enzyme
LSICGFFPVTTRRTLQLLQQYESRNITFLDPDGTWPIVWTRAKGCHVWDAEGRKYLDLTGAFGVAAAGHANPAVVRAGQKQMATLLHAMGDVHPHALKAELARELSRITYGRWSRLDRASGIRHPASGKSIFCNSGSEAVEAALKTARLATGKPGIIAFEGGYHGLGYGALNATHRDHFRSGFRDQLREFGRFVPFPSRRPRIPVRRVAAQNELAGHPCPAFVECESAIVKLLKHGSIGAILVEPIQARGGINVPPDGFLQMLRRRCDESGALLILDEIYTGFGRTGAWFACEHEHVVPDVVCLGKALTGGFPLSACIGRADVMDRAWPPSNGEAIHTSTFLGHPVGCAMALAQIAELKRLKLPQRSARLGRALLKHLAKIKAPGLTLSVRGLGLMAGLELRRPDGSPATEESLGIIKRLLQRGFVFLPEGEHAEVISFTPPLTLGEKDLEKAVRALEEELALIDHPR